MLKKELEEGIKHLSNNDISLATIIKKIGKCNLNSHNDYYYSLLGSIVSQQLSSRVADVIFGRFIDYFGDPVPEAILKAEDAEIRKLGLSNAKVKYVKDLSQKVINKEISFRGMKSKTDEEIIAELTKVKGVGVWTVHMFLIFTLGRLNILPVGDLGIKRAIMNLYKLKVLPEEKVIRKIAGKNNWYPYCSIACWYLWKSLELKEENN